MDISLVAYDGSFRERFFQIDSLANQTLDYDKFEYIFVETFDEVNPDLIEKLNSYPFLNYKTETLNRDRSYHLGKCVNHGVKVADGDIVVVLDADTYLEPEVLRKTLEYHRGNKDSVLYIHRYDEPQPPMLRNQELTLGKLRKRCELLNDSNFGGFMSIKKENYIKSGGYDEHWAFSGYDSAGAMDLKARFENMELNWKWHPDLKTYHICHENAFGDDRWGGFRVETQWRMIGYREAKGITKPLVGIAQNGYGDKRYRELDEWFEEWLERWDDKSVGYTP